MAYTGPHFPHGFQEIGFAALETAFDTDAKPVATDAFSALELSFDPEQAVIRSEEKTGNRLPPEFFPGTRSAKASASFYAKPNAVGVEPDVGAILEAALHNKTIVGGTSVTYAHKDDALVKSLRLHRGAGNFMESVFGAVVESLGFEISQGSPAKVSAAFAAARVARAHAEVLTVGGALGTGNVSVGAGKGKAFSKGSTVRFLKAGGGVEDNGGLGYLVTSDEADAITFAPNLVSAVAVGDEIMGFTPTPTVSGNVCAAVNQDVSVGGTSINFLSAKVNYKTGFRLRQEAQSDRPTGAFSGEGEVSGEIECYLRDDQHNTLEYQKWDKTYKAIVVRAGENVAGQRMKINITNALVEVSPVKVPAGDGTAATFTLKFRGKTAFSVVFD